MERSGLPSGGKELLALPAKVAGSLAIDAANSLYLPPNTHIDAFYTTNADDTGPRSLLMLAALYGAAECTSMLLLAGASPNLQAPDGATALHCACGNAVSSRAARVIAVLLRHGADRTLRDSSGRLPSDLLALALAPTQGAAERRETGTHHNPSHQTDHFRMYSFKIETCPRLGELHDWNDCPYLHPGEKARRRDPRVFTYQAVACPDFRKGSCRRGDGCPFAHGVFECWLHPDRYRTQLCKEGAACTRAVCFFAHTVDQLRDPPVALPPLDTAGRGGCSKGPGSRPTSPGSTLLPGALASASNGTSRCASPPATDAVAFGPLRRAVSVDTSRSGDSSAGSTPPLGCPITAALAQARQQAEHNAAAVAAAANVRALQQKQSAAAAAAAAALQQVLLAKAAANWPPASAPPQHGNGVFGSAPHACFPLAGGPAATGPGGLLDPWAAHLDAAPTANAANLGRSASAPVSALQTGGAAEANGAAAAAVQQLLAGLEL